MPRTKFDREDSIRGGNEMSLLSQEYRSRLEARCSPGLIDGLTADVPLLVDSTHSATNVRADTKTLTMGQNEALEKSSALMALLRDAICTHYTDKSIQSAFGVGTKVNPTSVMSVTAGIKRLVEAYGEHLDKARAAGILPEDVDFLQQARDVLAAANTKQENKKVSSKTATAERNAAHERVDAAITRIHSISQLVFRDEPKIRARFDAALPTTRAQKSYAKRKKTAADPKKPK